MSEKIEKPKLYCSFCGKCQDEIEKLIASPRNITICNECVVLCVEIVNEERQKTAAEIKAQSAPRMSLVDRVLGRPAVTP